MKKQTKAKEGAALVIALGFLGILTVMVFAFAVRTRTERVAGRTYLDNARASQLLQTALTRAMEDIDFTFGTNYPNLLAIGSASDAVAPISGTINFTTEENYLPLGNTAIEAAYLTAVDTANWLSVDDDNGSEIGRVAYIVVNTSGLLDANAVGAVDPNNELLARRSGRSPKEIQLSSELLPELNTSAQLTDSASGSLTDADSSGQALVHNRDNAWQRFETLRDIRMLNSDKLGGAIDGEISAFNVFSFFPTNEFQGLELTEAINEEQFEKVLIESCGFNAEEAQHIVDNYFDYIDADSIPRDLLGSSPEAVPMINEIWLDNVIFNHVVSDPTNINYEISGELYIETWYPFDEPQTDGGFIEVVATDPSNSNGVELIEGEDYILQSEYITVIVTYTNLSKALIIPIIELTSEQSEGGHFTQYSYEFEFNESIEFEVPLSTVADAEPTSIHLMNEEIEIIIGETVDRVENTDLELNFTDEETRDGTGYGCYDPRVNHDFGTHWQALDNATPNEVNELDDWGEEEDLADKESIRFFVSNQPMTNAAELGHLSTGQPWDTIRLYAGSEAPDPVLDHFYTAADSTNAPAQNGLININSPHANVLATAFYKAPFPVLEAESLVSEITEEQALVLGQTLASLSENADNKLSHLGKALSASLPDWENLTDAQKDSIVGNTYRLFGSRDSSYTILLVAQAGTDTDGNGLDDEEIRSSQQAIVNVWRDPNSQKAAITFFGLTDTLRSTFAGGGTWGDLLNAFKP